jgi:hypothetical protein
MAARVPGLTKPPFKSFKPFKPSGKDQPRTNSNRRNSQKQNPFGSKNSSTSMSPKTWLAIGDSNPSACSLGANQNTVSAELSYKQPSIFYLQGAARFQLRNGLTRHGGSTNEPHIQKARRV